MIIALPLRAWVASGLQVSLGRGGPGSIPSSQGSQSMADLMDREDPSKQQRRRQDHRGQCIGDWTHVPGQTCVPGTLPVVPRRTRVLSDVGIVGVLAPICGINALLRLAGDAFFAVLCEASSIGDRLFLGARQCQVAVP